MTTKEEYYRRCAAIARLIAVRLLEEKYWENARIEFSNLSFELKANEPEAIAMEEASLELNYEAIRNLERGL